MAIKKVKLYVGNDSVSILAHDYLIKNKVSFEEIDATTETGFKKLTKFTKQSKTPFLEVRHSHSVNTSIGFDEFLYASALNPMLSYDKFIQMKQEQDKI